MLKCYYLKAIWGILSGFFFPSNLYRPIFLIKANNNTLTAVIWIASTEYSLYRTLCSTELL